MQEWNNTVSASASTVSRTPISEYVQSSEGSDSPIDSFYKGRNLILRDISPEIANGNSMLAALSMVGFISLTENYFREVLAEIMAICPLAKVNAAEKSINLATAWFGYEQIEKAAFENISFSNTDTIKKNFKAILSLTIESSNQIYQPLESFSELCELRHSVVHSAGFLSGKNAVKLKLPSSPSEVSVNIDYDKLQEAAEVCTSLVCSSNLELFKHIAKRWLHDWPREVVYESSNMNESFKQLWSVFYSTVDENLGEIENNMTMIKTRNLIKRVNAA